MYANRSLLIFYAVVSHKLSKSLFDMFRCKIELRTSLNEPITSIDSVRSLQSFCFDLTEDLATTCSSESANTANYHGKIQCSRSRNSQDFTNLENLCEGIEQIKHMLLRSMQLVASSCTADMLFFVGEVCFQYIVTAANNSFILGCLHSTTNVLLFLAVLCATSINNKCSPGYQVA